jgi:hypothetical protein
MADVIYSDVVAMRCASRRCSIVHKNVDTTVLYPDLFHKVVNRRIVSKIEWKETQATVVSSSSEIAIKPRTIVT